MKRLSTNSSNFYKELNDLLAFETEQNADIDQIVAEICQTVAQDGDKAVIEYTNRFDHTHAKTMADLRLSQDELKQAFFRLPENTQTALKTAAGRIRVYHERQKQESWHL